MNRHDYVPNGLNDYCLTCDLPRYSAVHEAQEVKLVFGQPIQGTWVSEDDVRKHIEAQQKAKRLGDLIDTGRLVTSVWAPVKGEAWTAKDVARAFGVPPWWL